jgi:hypothetical protein
MRADQPKRQPAALTNNEGGEGPACAFDFDRRQSQPQPRARAAAPAPVQAAWPTAEQKRAGAEEAAAGPAPPAPRTSSDDDAAAPSARTAREVLQRDARADVSKFFADMKQTAAAAVTGVAATGTAASQRSENSVTMEANQQRQVAIQAGLSGAQAAKERPLIERPAEREASVEEQRAAMKARALRRREQVMPSSHLASSPLVSTGEDAAR